MCIMVNLTYTCRYVATRVYKEVIFKSIFKNHIYYLISEGDICNFHLCDIKLVF